MTGFILGGVALAGALCAVNRAAASEATARAPRCGVDEGRDRVCGPRPGALSGKPAPACPASPAMLDLRLYQPVVYSDPRPGDEELVRLGYPGFVFELEREREYPREQARDGFRPSGGIPLTECCYVKCTPVQVAPEGSAAGSRMGLCIEPPGGGTRFPVPGAPECPRAVKVAGAFRSYTGRNAGGACCYAVPPPPPPSVPRP